MGANRAGHVSHMSSRRELTSILSERLMKAELLQPLTEGYKFSKSLSIRLYLRWFYKGSRSLPTFTGITVTTANLCSHGVGVLMTVCNNRGITLQNHHHKSHWFTAISAQAAAIVGRPWPKTPGHRSGRSWFWGLSFHFPLISVSSAD